MLRNLQMLMCINAARIGIENTACDGNIVGFMCCVVQSYVEWRRWLRHTSRCMSCFVWIQVEYVTLFICTPIF